MAAQTVLQISPFGMPGLTVAETGVATHIGRYACWPRRYLGHAQPCVGRPTGGAAATGPYGVRALGNRVWKSSIPTQPGVMVMRAMGFPRSVLTQAAPCSGPK